jgi:Zn-dependent protease
MATFAITVGSGFLLHELAHKYFAVKYGAYARYQTWSYGLYLMLGLAIIPQLLGFKLPLFLAPGAVMIYTTRGLTLKQNGVISAAGPATNLLLAVAFFAFSVLAFGAGTFSGVTSVNAMGEIVATVMLMGVQVNFFLAMFNLLPIPPLDGSKVIAWNWMIWLGMFAIAFIGSSLITF